MSERADVLVVGGGVMGCATAFYLAGLGVKVHILERDSIGSQASGVAAGLLYPLSESGQDDPEFKLSMLGQMEHRRLAQELLEETGIDVGFAPLSDLRLALDAEEESPLRQLVAWHKEHNIAASWVSPDDLHRLEPRITSDALGAFCLEDQAQVDSFSLVMALGQACKRRHVQVIRGEATGVNTQGSRIRGVVTHSGFMEAEQFVFALGPWSYRLESWLGVRVPVKPLRGQILTLQTQELAFHYAIHHQGNYVVSKASGELIVGTTEEDAGFESTVTDDGKSTIMYATKKIIPSLAQATITGSRAGLRPVSADGKPIIGQLTGWDNAFVMTGHGRKGILQSLPSAMAIAGLATGKVSPIPLTDFAPGRFL
jgi:glycine oxidase